MTRAVYLLGGPGAGKSTLMAELLRGWTPGPYTRFTTREMFGHWMLNDDLELGAYLGRLREEYPGTDALSMSVAPHALSWLSGLKPTVARVFGEGTRLGHLGFLSALHERTRLTVCYLELDETEAAVRRAARPGKKLSEQYAKMATSKAANAALMCEVSGIPVVTLDARLSPRELGKIVRGLE